MKRGLQFLLFSEVWFGFSLGMLGPIYALFVEEIGGSLLDASWAFFAFTFTSGVVIYLISLWEDHIIHKEKLIVFGYFLTSVGVLSYYFVGTQSHLVLTQIVLGLAGAFLFPAYDALYTEYIDHHKEASQWGACESLYKITTAIAAVVGGYIAYLLGFKTLFLVMFVFSFMSVIISYKMYKHSPNYLKKQI
jgi:MFS family permease